MLHHLLKRIVIFTTLTTCAFSLSACFKVRITINVNPDESGMMGFAFGMTSQAKALVASQSDSDPMQTLSKNLSDNPDNPQEVKITRWTEGEYEWIQGEVAFEDLNELNERMSRVDFFESFSITRQTSFLKNKFILTASLGPLSESTSSSDIDPSAFIEVQMFVHLPGKIIETNGIFDGEESSNLVWTVNNKQTTTMKATSESWNSLNIVVIGVVVGVIILGVICIMFLIIFVYRRRNKTRMQ